MSTTPASIKKHPWHPMLITLPIGLWVFSFISDLILYFGWGGPVWGTVALYTMGGGIITALIAAVPGFIDLLSIRQPQLRKTALIHMGLNLAVVALFVADYVVRISATTPISWPILLSLAGLVLLTVSGWLGAELVHIHGISVADHYELPSPQTPIIPAPRTVEKEYHHI